VARHENEASGVSNKVREIECAGGCGRKTRARLPERPRPHENPADFYPRVDAFYCSHCEHPKAPFGQITTYWPWGGGFWAFSFSTPTDEDRAAISRAQRLMAVGFPKKPSLVR
jgi:hypothetical protein